MPYSNSIFVDTSALLAMVNSHDDYHDRVVDFMNNWKDKFPQYTNLATSDYVLSETITKIRFRISNDAALTFGKAVLNSKLLDIIYVDKEGFKEAWNIFYLIENANVKDHFIKNEDTTPISDKNHHATLSYIDATILACINLYNIPALFTFDQDFHYLSKHGILKDIGFLKNRNLQVYPVGIHYIP